MRRVRFWVYLLTLMLAVPVLMAQVATFPRYRLGGGSSGTLAEVDSSGRLQVSITGTASAQSDPGYQSFPRYRLGGGSTGNLVEVDSSGHLLVSCSDCISTSSTLGVANGGTNLTTATDDNVMVGNGTTWQSKAVPDCDDTVGQHLNYDTTTNAFSCGTSKPVDYRTCTLVVGTDNGSALADADLGPQGRQCFIPVAATLVEIFVAGDGGTPNVIPRRNRAGVTANFVSSALATAAAGGLACSKTGAVTCLDGATTASATLQNTGLNAGDWIELGSGTAGGVAKRMSISLIYSIP